MNSQCPEKYNYSYLYNDGNPELKAKTICTRDPSTVSQIKKAHTPLKMCYDKETFHKNANNTDYEEHTCDGDKLFDIFKPALEKVVQALNDVCAPDNSLLAINIEEGCIDGIGIIPEGRAGGAFTEVDNKIYTAIGFTETIFPNYPIPGFGSGLLYLNLTDEFRDGNDKFPPHCWSKECDAIAVIDPNSGKTKTCIEMETILMHEIAHALGLGHIEGLKSNHGFDSFGSPCNTDASMAPENITSETMLDGYLSDNFQNRSSISCYMGCALKKLYCPDLAGFRKSATLSGCQPTAIEAIWPFPSSIKLVLYPQPTSINIFITIQSNEKYLALDIYSADGSIVDKRIIEMRSLKETVTIPTQSYSSGTYYAVVSSDSIIKSMRFLVTR